MKNLASLLIVAGFVACSLHVVQEERGYDSFVELGSEGRSSWGSSDTTLWLNNSKFGQPK